MLNGSINGSSHGIASLGAVSELQRGSTGEDGSKSCSNHCKYKSWNCDDENF